MNLSKQSEASKKITEYLNTMPAGSKLPSEREMAQLMGISRPTLRKAMSAFVTAGLLRPVRGSGIYVVKSLAGGSHKKICLAYSADIRVGTDPFFSLMISHIELEVTGRGGIFLAASIADDGMPPPAVREADGIITMGVLNGSALPKDRPVTVVLESGCPLPEASYVLVDNYLGGFMVARHILSLGHRQVAFAGPANAYLSAGDRYRGACDALKEAGLEPPALINARMNLAGGREAAAAVKESGVTAVICSNDWLAMGMVDALHRLGIRVPEDISVTGFDDIPAALFFKPALTTVSIPVPEIASIAVKELIERIDAGGRAMPKRILLPAEIVARESCRKIKL